MSYIADQNSTWFNVVMVDPTSIWPCPTATRREKKGGIRFLKDIVPFAKIFLNKVTKHIDNTKI